MPSRDQKSQEMNGLGNSSQKKPVIKSAGLDGKFEEHPGPGWTTNFFSRLTFWEATPIVRLGAKRPLEHEDLWKIRSDMSSVANWNAFRRYWKEETQLPPEKASLWRAVRRTYFGEWMLAVFLSILYGIISFSTSILMPYVMKWLTAKVYPMFIEPELAHDWLGYLYLVDIVVATLLGSLCMYHSQLVGWRLGVKIRAVLTLVSYRKALKLGNTKTRNTGNVVNLIAQDAQLITDTLPFFNQGFIAPLQIIVGTVLLWLEIGAFSLIPLGVFFVALPFAGILGKRVGLMREKAQQAADSRIKLVKEMITGIRIVKYMAWERPFEATIEKAREHEVERLKKMALARSYMISVMMSVPNVGIGLTFFTYSFSVDMLDSSKIFTALSLLNLIRLPFAFLPMMITLGTQYAVTFKRLNEFLLQPEVEKRPERPLQDVVLRMKNADFAWNKDEEPVLKDLNLKVKKGQLVMVVGSVGSGKSTLLQSALGEVFKLKGEVELNGSIAYVAQEAWIINATVRDNILFGKPYDPKLYKEVVEIAALQPDFDIMPAGDMTEIGDKGINLSGGQRQRISIARALYQERDVYIMDDPLSAVDSHVGAHIMEKAILGFLKKKGRTVILALNQIQFLPQADHVVFLKNNTIAEQGKFSDLVASGRDLAQLAKEFGVTDEDQQIKSKEGDKKSKSEKDEKEIDLSKANLTGEEEKEVGLIGFSTYWLYVVSGGLGYFFAMCFCLLIGFGAQVFYSIWLSDWTDPAKYMSRNYPKYVWQVVFISGIVAQIVFLILKAVLSAYWGRNASRVLHRQLLSRIVRATTGFFDATPLGRMINRFAKDMGWVDHLLPMQFDQFITMVFALLALLAQVAASSPYILIGIAVAVVLYIFMLQYYRRTSIAIQRLEAVSRSPIFSHLNESLEGGATIRAYNMQKRFKIANMNRIDANSIDFYSLRYCGMWFGIRLDWIGTAIVLTVWLAIVLLRNFGAPEDIDVSLAGLALSSANGVVLLLGAISMNFNELEVKMNSVERIDQYKSIEQEAAEHVPDKVPPEWPQRGKIEFRSLSIAYGNNPPVLKKISLKIKPREKIGLVGRTGSGKSTLVTALFRLVEPCDGTILIDDVDIRELGLRDLRSKLSIIPQTPTLFIGTVRYNVDPFNTCSDHDIWQALERVQLKEVIQNMPGGLDAMVEENGQNFSVGQRQLLAMARALIRDAPILLLDESTASLSNDSDAMIQKMVRKHFKDKTIITIAHRLHTIMDSDRVIVLDKGEVVEFDSPRKLLQKKDGLFTSMVNATGKSSAEHLRKIAFGEITFDQAIEDSESQMEEDFEANLDKELKAKKDKRSAKKGSSKKEIIDSKSKKGPSKKKDDSSEGTSSEDSSEDANEESSEKSSEESSEESSEKSSEESSKSSSNKKAKKAPSKKPSKDSSEESSADSSDQDSSS